MQAADDDSSRNWRERFPNAVRVLKGEGESVHLTESEGAWWVVYDSGTLNGLLSDEDRGGSVRIERFDSEDAAYLSVGRRTADRTATIAGITVSKAAPRIAREIERLAEDRGLVRINERDHVGPLASEVIGRTHPTVADPLVSRPQARHGLEAQWPRLGRIDLALGGGPHLPAFIEMKCGSGRDALAACAWDALKLAYCLEAGVSSAGLLLAATTADDWRRPVRGAEFFTDAEFSTEDLYRGYADWWLFWERDGAGSHDSAGYRPPPSVPGAFRTRQAARPEPFMVGRTEWELRIATVESLHGARFAWRPFLGRGETPA